MSKDNINDRLTIEIKEQIAFVTLERPDKHNALDMAMFYAIRDAVKRLHRNRNIRAVIITGAGEDFCSGLDVKSVMKSKSAPLKLLFKWLPWQANLAQYVSTGWRSLPVPVIAAIHGRCWGGGLQIAQGADFIITDPNASLAIMEAKWGLIPDMGGSLAVRESLNLDVAKRLAMTGEQVSGQDAVALGLASSCSENAKEEAIALAQALKVQSPDSVAGVKKLYNKSWFGSAGMALARESYYQIRILMGKNSKIKRYNQLNTDKPEREFKPRKSW